MDTEKELEKEEKGEEGERVAEVVEEKQGEGEEEEGERVAEVVEQRNRRRLLAVTRSLMSS